MFWGKEHLQKERRVALWPGNSSKGVERVAKSGLMGLGAAHPFSPSPPPNPFP
jgi:hypothetical protein